jgi:phytoene desaturase
MSAQPNQAIVIGTGFGGLASAIRLRARGWNVTILEANEQPGGRASVFQRDGFTFDAGPTVITAPYLFEELFAMVGRDWKDYFTLTPVDPFYRIEFHDGSNFDYVGDEERLLANIHALNPADVDNYRRMLKHMEEIFNIGYLKLSHVPFDRLSDMLRVVPDMLRLGNYRSVYGMVSQYMQDERLRQVFSFQPLLVGGNPFSTSSIYTLIHFLERKWGVHFAMGGTGAIVQGMTRLLGELGVTIHYNAPVNRIEVEGGDVRRVHVEDGRSFDAKLIVCNADPTVVYETMIDARHRRKYTDRAVRRRRQSMSLFVSYFGTRKTYPDIKHHTIILGPRYKGLLDDIFKRRVLADDFSLYLHAPTRTDPSVAPPGHESFYVLSPVPNQLSGLNWEEYHEEYQDRILTALDQTHLPGLKDNLVTHFSVDPRYFEGRLRSRHGAAFGIEPVLTQSAYFRYHNRSDDVGNLFFVGASTHPGAGVPGVLCSAKVLEMTLPALAPEHQEPVPGVGSSHRLAPAAE